MKIDQTKLGQFDRTIKRCEVVDIPAGATPKYISVQLPGPDGAVVDAWWDGSLRLSVGNFVKLLRSTDAPQYEVVGTSGTTPGTVPIPETLIDAKGDLIVGSAADTAARLAVGANNTILTADSAEVVGAKWAYPDRIIYEDGTLIALAVFTLGQYWLSSPLLSSSIRLTGLGVIDLDGIADALILDADQDTTISSPTDDQIDFEAGGSDVATLTASGLALASGARLNEFSTDGTFAGDSDTAAPTEQAVNEFVTLIVKNTSGATANAGEMGYLTYTAGSGIEYKTTTTAGDNKADRGCVVIVGGANNANIKVRRNGRWTIPYAGSAPSQGDYLVFSTTAGKVAAQSYMSPGVVGIAMAAGSGGNVDALLLCNTVFVEEKITVCWALLNHSDLDFVATINGTPSGTSVVYNAPSAGNEDCLNIYTAEGSNWKLTLHNTTRGTSALIGSTNTGTNTITLTATVPAGWASGDTITIRSQTQTTTIASAYFVDINTNGTIPALTRAMLIPSAKMDTGAASERVDLAAFQAALVSDIYRTQVANVYMEYKADIPVINGRFCLLSTASGTGTGNTWLRQSGYWVAAP